MQVNSENFKKIQENSTEKYENGENFVIRATTSRISTSDVKHTISALFVVGKKENKISWLVWTVASSFIRE